MEPQSGIKILPEQLAAETLRGVIEEFVTRDGTDLAETATKVREVADLLRRGRAEIWYDPATRTCTIAPSPSSQ